jgi:DNA-binding XRE family transcriptional regulator
MQQGELAERLGITQAYISMLEAGKKTPSMTICLLLDCLEKEVRG